MTDTLKTISPIDGRVYVERPQASIKEINTALDAALAAQTQWAAEPLAQRCALLHNAVDAFVAKAPLIANEITWQMGRPIAHTPGEVRGFEERARHMLAIAPDALAPIDPGPKEHFERAIKRVPLGVIVVIAPWNYPFLTAVNAIIPALIAGNTVILKHSHQTPLAAERFAEAFIAAGLPEGVFQYLHLSHTDTARLMADSRVANVCFTGSVAGGKAVTAAISAGFATAGLELGGKDPAYVRADANLAYAIETLTDGAFFNSGQSCCGVKRIYVAENHYDDFVAGVVDTTHRYVLGSPVDPATTLGPVVRSSAADALRAQVAAAIAQGARQLISEARFSASAAGTPYMAPQVLTHVDHSMAVMREESFGPVVGIMKVSSDTEAVRLMNDSAFGLTAAIFSADVERAWQLADALETGTVFLNRCDYLDPALAWTGVKHSGRGATLSRVGFEAVTRPKSYHFKVKP